MYQTMRSRRAASLGAAAARREVCAEDGVSRQSSNVPIMAFLIEV
jgi:hypothetical protein